MANFAFLSTIGFVFLVALAAYIFYVSSQRSRGIKMRYSVSIISALLIGAVAFGLLGAGLVFIQPQERAIVLSPLSNTGYRGEALSPGAHVIVPGIETARRISVAQQDYTMSKTAGEGKVHGDDSVTARTADGQEVFIDASVQYQVDPTRVTDLFIKWQDRYADDFVRPQSRSIIYNRVAQYKVEEIYSTKRDELQAKITDELRTVFERDGLRLTSFLLRNVTFSPEYAKSVEEKQIAQQNAERARFLVQSEEQEAARVRVQAKGQADAAVTRAQGDADAQLIRAKADAESLKVVSAAIKDNPDVLTLRYIEKLAPTVQTIMLPSNQSLILDAKTLSNQIPRPTTVITTTK